MLPILYSFRRCPYAIRARLCIAYASINLEIREVSLANKPIQMLALSPKGTVPVLQLENKVIDESLEIIRWALNQSDPDNWLATDCEAEQLSLIEENDHKFKIHLDKYKYWDRFPEQPQAFYRHQAEPFIANLESLLNNKTYLFGSKICRADIAILPFIRQFAFVDKAWFDQANYPAVQHWLNEFMASSLFVQIMEKQPIWEMNSPIV